MVAPKILHQAINFFSIGSRVYPAGFILLVLGVMLLILSTKARLFSYLVTLGLILAASGLSIFFFPLKRTKKLLARLGNQSNIFLRILAIIGIAIWAGLVYALLPATFSLPR